VALQIKQTEKPFIKAMFSMAKDSQENIYSTSRSTVRLMKNKIYAGWRSRTAFVEITGQNQHA
jgi:hypothetical protein